MIDIGTLIRYKAWANTLLYRCLSSLDEAGLNAPHPIVFGSLIRTLNHVYSMDHVWKCHLLGAAHGLTSRNPSECPSFDSLAQSQDEIDQWFVAYGDALAGPQLSQNVEFNYIGGNAGSMSRMNILLHVVNHATYHRGHIAAMLYELGVTPPTTDLTVFLSSSVDQTKPLSSSGVRSSPTDE